MGLDYDSIRAGMMVGDYELAARMLGITRDSIRQRVLRRKEDALLALRAIAENRESLIREWNAEYIPR